MVAISGTKQAIARLTPLLEVLATIDLRVKPVLTRTMDVSLAAGRALASDAMTRARPNAPIALVDGWAISAYDTFGAGNHAPALLPQMPRRVDAGQPLPPGSDSIAPFRIINIGDGTPEAVASVNPGDGVLAAGGDCDPAMPLRRTGERLRTVDLAVFAAAGLARITVREPRIHVLPVRGNSIINAAARLVAGDVERQGGAARVETGRDLGLALFAESADGIVVIGGTGGGRNDTSVVTLAREGELAAHGVALTPGETAAFGFIGSRPVLLLPGRIDAALAVWLTIGRRLLARLAGGDDSEPMATAILTRKITSSVGIAEFVPVRRLGDMAEPLASKYLPLSTLARADGWVLVPAECEALPEGSRISVRTWP